MSKFMIHSFLPEVHLDTEILILGSVPGIPSLNKQEYYGNKNNAFWRILFLLFKEEYSDEYNDKLQLLKKNKIGLWDTIKSCDRGGSLDSAIKNIVPNKLKLLCEKHSEIKIIAFNGKSAEKYYEKHIGKVKNITYYSLPSTSPANARMNFATKLEKWSILS